MADNGSTRFEMRAGNDWLRKLDCWRRGQDDLPSRAEAIRRLVERGLQAPIFKIGDMVIADDRRTGTIVGLDNANPLVAKVDFDSETNDFSSDGELMLVSKLELFHHNGDD